MLAASVSVETNCKLACAPLDGPSGEYVLSTDTKLGGLLTLENTPIVGHTDPEMETIDQTSLRDLTILSAVAREGSFASAGRSLGLPRNGVSRHIAMLEDRLGVRLFQRTTRKVAPTEAARRLLAQIEHPLGQMRTALEAVGDRNEALEGNITLSVSHAFGRHFIIPFLAEFQRAHPGIRIDLHLSDTIEPLIERAVDLVIRIGPLPESSLIARRLGSIEAGLFASTDLVTKTADPHDEAILRNRPFIGFRVPGSGQLLALRTSNPRVGQALEALEPAFICNSLEGIRDLVMAGRGVGALPLYMVSRDLSAGRLIRVLPTELTLSVDVHICFISRRHAPQRVRLLLEHLAKDVSRRLKAAESETG